MNENSFKTSYLNYLRVIFFLSFLMTGLYFEIECVIVSILLFALLIWKCLIHKDPFVIYGNPATLAFAVLFLGYLVTPLWGIDKGVSWWGICRMMVVILFLLCTMQLTREERRPLLRDIPYIGAFMVMFTAIAQFVPGLKAQVIANDRLAGPFLYQNAFACFLLLGLVIIWSKLQYMLLTDIPIQFVLLLGIFMAASRVAFVFVLLLMVVFHIRIFYLRKKNGLVSFRQIREEMKEKKNKILFFGSLATFPVAYGIAWLLNHAIAHRMITFSDNLTWMMQRLVYWKDALSVIVRHPFGIGFMGYYFIQPTVQSGAYSNRWVMNDYLQLLMDIGWIPMVILLVAIGLSFATKKLQFEYKIMMATLLCHACLDFDFEFVSFYFILILCMHTEAGKKIEIGHMQIVTVVISIMMVGNVYLGISAYMTSSGRSDSVTKFYPFNTFANLEMIARVSDLDLRVNYAEKVLAVNSQVALPYDVKAVEAYNKKDWAKMEEYKEIAISKNPFHAQEYEDYYLMLLAAYNTYDENGDSASANKYRDKIIALESRMKEAMDRVGTLAKKAQLEPTMSLSQQYYDWVKKHQ